jgi:hypothetical protein
MWASVIYRKISCEEYEKCSCLKDENGVPTALNELNFMKIFEYFSFHKEL